jgi:hypothetical protein
VKAVLQKFVKEEMVKRASGGEIGQVSGERLWPR